MSFNFKVGGTWRTLASGWVKVGGAWQEVQSAWVKVGGAWQQVYVALTINLSGTAISPVSDSNFALDPATATAGWSFNKDGDATRVSGTAYNPTPDEWADPNTTDIGSSYWIRFTAESGDAVTIGTLNTWLALTTTRTFYWQVSGGILSGVVKVEIASDSGGSTIVATGYYSGQAESTP